MNCAHGMTHDQAQACADNPLAAYLGGRLPVLIMLVMVSNVVGLILVTLSLLSNLTHSAFLLNPATVHALSFTFTLWMLVTGMVLAFELWWIKKNHLVPEQLRRRKQVPGLWRRSTDPRPATLEEDPGAAVAISDVAGEDLKTVDELLEVMGDLVYYLQREVSSRVSMQHASQHKLVAESHRAVEVLCQTLADIVEINRRALHEKERMGYTGTGTGFKQLAHTHKTLEVVTASAEAGARLVRSPKKGTCKHRNASHTRHRRSQDRDIQPKGEI